MKISFRTALYSYSAFVTLGLAFATAQAQEATDLGTVVLGKGKREVQTQNSDAVTVINQEEINDRQAGTIAELINSVPGVTLVNGATPQGSGINIRGFGANGTFGSDQKVLIQIDGAHVGSEELYRIGTQLYTDPALYKSVTVNRGTIGSFEYGSGVIGGLVRLETIDASDLTGGKVGSRFRQTLQYNTNGAAKISSSTLALQTSNNAEFLANFTYRDQNDMKNGDGKTLNYTASRLPSYLLKGAVNFGNDDESRFEVSYSDTSTSEKDVPYDTFQTTGGGFGNVDRDTKSRTLAAQYNYNPLNDLINIDAQLTYADQKIDQQYINGTSICQTNPSLIPQCGRRGFNPALQNADHRYETVKLSLKNSMFIPTDTLTHDLRIGGEVMRKKRLNASSAPGGTDQRLAAFIVDDIAYHRWTISPSLRYETSSIDSSTSTESYRNNALMGGASLRYDFESGFAIFGSSAYTENLPIIDDLGNATRMEQSEKSRTHELGLSFDGQTGFSTKFNVYQSNLWDITSYVSFAPGASTSKVKRRGIEAEATYATKHGTYIDFNASASKGTATLESGATENWDNNPADSLGLTLGQKMNNGLDLSWEAVANASRVNDTVTNPGYVVNNLRATWIPNNESRFLQGAEFRLGIENIFNRQYRQTLATRDAPGRNIKLTISKTF